MSPLQTTLYSHSYKDAEINFILIIIAYFIRCLYFPVGYGFSVLEFKTAVQHIEFCADKHLIACRNVLIRFRTLLAHSYIVIMVFEA